MEFKGISWAGNVYEKFEAMCLEVEEVIYEDTVKYMENQVQKVGKSVKKFYSEVMHDFLPPSCMEPVRMAAADLSPNPYSHVDINKKPKLCILELKKKDTSSEDNCNLTSEEKNSQLLQSCRVLVENTNSGMCSAKSMTVGVHKRPIGIKRISRTNSPRTSGPATCLPRDRSNLMVHDTRRDCTITSNDMNAARFSESSVKFDPEEAQPRAVSVSVSDALEKTFTSGNCLAAESPKQEDNSEMTLPANTILPVETQRLDDNNSECSSSFHGFPAKHMHSFSSAVTSNLCDVESSGQTAMTSYKDKLAKDDSISQVHLRNTNSDGCDVSASKEVIVSHEEYFDMESIENKKDSGSADIEDYEPVEKPNSEDTCVFVESYFVHQGSQQNKSYKKKFQDALSSKLGPTRKQKQSNTPYKDSDAEKNADAVSPDLTMKSSYKNSPGQDSFGSDWELI